MRKVDPSFQLKRNSLNSRKSQPVPLITGSSFKFPQQEFIASKGIKASQKFFSQDLSGSLQSSAKMINIKADNTRGQGREPSRGKISSFQIIKNTPSNLNRRSIKESKQTEPAYIEHPCGGSFNDSYNNQSEAPAKPSGVGKSKFQRQSSIKQSDKSQMKIIKEGEYIIKGGTSNLSSSNLKLAQFNCLSTKASSKYTIDNQIKSLKSIGDLTEITEMTNIKNQVLGQSMDAQTKESQGEKLITSLVGNKNSRHFDVSNMPLCKSTCVNNNEESRILKDGDILPKYISVDQVDIPENKDLEIQDICPDFIAILASSLAKIDYRLSNPEFRGDIKECLEVRKLKHVYKKFVSRFLKVGQINNIVFVYSLALAKKVKKSLTKDYEFSEGDFLKIYGCCLFLSIKMVIDMEKWYLEDFEYVSGIPKETIEALEIFILDEALNFDISIPRTSYREEHLRLYKNIQKRVSK